MNSKRQLKDPIPRVKAEVPSCLDIDTKNMSVRVKLHGFKVSPEKGQSNMMLMFYPEKFYCAWTSCKLDLYTVHWRQNRKS